MAVTMRTMTAEIASSAMNSVSTGVAPVDAVWCQKGMPPMPASALPPAVDGGHQQHKAERAAEIEEDDRALDERRIASDLRIVAIAEQQQMLQHPGATPARGIGKGGAQRL